MNDSIDLTQARICLTDLISQAGEILKKYFISGDFTSRSKGWVDFLTQADQEVDNFLLKNIKKHYPSCPILTEESAPDDYSTYKDKENLWVVDPLDGTINFSRGHPHFSISVGLVDKGVSRFGIVSIPMEDKLYWVQADQDQAFLNDKPLHVSSTADLKTTVLATDWGWVPEGRLKVVSWLGSIANQVRQIKSMGSAVADLASLAEGKIDVYIHSGLKPWDVAVSSLLIEKAGGKITTPTGEPWNVFNPDMLATNGILHDKILTLINKSP